MAKLVFFDIETVSIVPSYEKLSLNLQKLWDKKSEYRQQETWLSSSVLFSQKAWIYAEFWKIVCLVAGYHTEQSTFSLKTFYGDDEVAILQDFFAFLWSFSEIVLCGHNIKEFDIPYVCRRSLINDIPLPNTFYLQWAKPREIKHKDTLEMRKFGDYKHYTSLSLLCEIFHIETPKDDIDGSLVGKMFWEEEDIDRIVNYCQKDVVTVAQIILRMKNLPLLEEAQVEMVP